MTDDRSLERAARSWIEAGPTRAPERAVEAALLRIESVSQERDLSVPWRSHQMNIPLRIAMGTAAIVAIAILVVTLLPERPAPSVGDPGPSPISAPPTTLSPAPSAAVLRFGPLTAGTYATQAAFPVRITLALPGGWAGLATSGATVSIIQSDAEVDSAFLGFWIVETAHRDPCGMGGVVDSPVGPTVEDLAAALAGAPGFDATEPTAVSVGGVDGQYLELTGPLAGCMEPELFRTPDGSCRCMESRVERNRLWIFDVDGRRLVIDALDIPPSDGVTGTSATDIAELQGIIDSIQISR